MVALEKVEEETTDDLKAFPPNMEPDDSSFDLESDGDDETFSEVDISEFIASRGLSAREPPAAKTTTVVTEADAVDKTEVAHVAENTNPAIADPELSPSTGRPRTNTGPPAPSSIPVPVYTVNTVKNKATSKKVKGKK